MSQVYGKTPPEVDISKNAVLLVITVFSFTLGAITTCMRMATRAFVVRSLGWDDWTLLAAQLFGAIGFGIVLKFCLVGGARPGPEYYPDSSHYVGAQEFSLIGQIPFILALCLTRISISFMVLRIKNTKKIKQYMHMLIWFQISVNGTSFIFLMAECRPFEALWDEGMVGGYCVPNHIQAALALLQGICSIIADLICTFLPILVIWKVQVSVGKRMSICVLVSLGLMATICCICRVQVYVYAKSLPGKTSLAAWWAPEFWGVLEQNVGFIGTNAPALMPLYNILLVHSISAFNSFRRSILRSSRATTTEPTSVLEISNNKAYLANNKDSLSSAESASTTRDLPLQNFSVKSKGEDLEGEGEGRGGDLEMGLPENVLQIRRTTEFYVRREG